MALTDFSCGGVVVDGGKLLLIRAKNLKNRKVWTFPKGHPEPEENSRQAALREVEEETGYKCKIFRPLLKARYYFSLNNELIKKSVQWYLMGAVARSGKPDKNEICESTWVSFRKAAELLEYPSDKKLLAMVEKLTSRKVSLPPPPLKAAV